MSGRAVKGYLFAVISAVIYGCMPLMAKFIYADGVNPFTLVFLRNAFSVVPLGVLAYFECGSLKIPAKALPKITIMSALGCSITPMLLFSSYNFMPSGVATVIHFAYPALVILGQALFAKQKAQAGNILGVLLCVAGVACFYSPSGEISLAGSGLALASAATFAAYVILLSNFKLGIPKFLFSFYITLASSAISLALCLASGNLALPASILGWGLCILFSLLVSVGAVVLFQQGVFLIGGERVSILSTLEPITGVIVGILIFSEPAGLLAIVGTCLVISASLLIAIIDIKAKRARP
ncbi:MAG: DMT family transporter [Clostridia bacterium]|nr:DMT family transporter [Clostridia bacterium]